MLNLPSASILGGDPFSDIFKGLYSSKKFWDLTNPDYCLSAMQAAYDGGCRVFDYSFESVQDIYLRLKNAVDDNVVGISNTTWLQGFYLEDLPLQYCRHRIMQTIISERGLLTKDNKYLIQSELMRTVPMVFHFDQARPLTDAEISSIVFDKEKFEERFEPISKADYVFVGGTDADWLFSIGRGDLIQELVNHVHSLGCKPILICHYASFMLSNPEVDSLNVHAIAVPLNREWAWFSLSDTLEAVIHITKPLIAFMPFGSGSLINDLSGAIKFLSDIPQIEGVMFGTASVKHALQSSSLIEHEFQRIS